MRTTGVAAMLAAFITLAAVYPSIARANPTNGRFVVTTAAVDAYGPAMDTVANDACVAEFGTGYRVADWNDIVSFFAAATEASEKEWYVNLRILPAGSYGMSTEASYLVSLGGDETYNPNRHYYLMRFDGVVPGYALVHESLNNQELNLGSWYLSVPALCYHM